MAARLTAAGYVVVHGYYNNDDVLKPGAPSLQLSIRGWGTVALQRTGLSEAEVAARLEKHVRHQRARAALSALSRAEREAQLRGWVAQFVAMLPDPDAEYPTCTPALLSRREGAPGSLRWWWPVDDFVYTEAVGAGWGAGRAAVRADQRLLKLLPSLAHDGQLREPVDEMTEERLLEQLTPPLPAPPPREQVAFIKLNRLELPQRRSESTFVPGAFFAELLLPTDARPKLCRVVVKSAPLESARAPKERIDDEMRRQFELSVERAYRDAFAPLSGKTNISGLPFGIE